MKHRNYRLYWTGQLISQTGSWMALVALSWLVWQLSHDPATLGLVAALQYLPSLLLTPLGGFMADRFSKRQILLVTQTAYIAPALYLAVLSSTHQARVWQVAVAALVVGTINALDVPTRQAFVPEIVGRGDILNAVALNSSMFNAARVVGPAVAGVVIGAVGVDWCFVANAASSVASIYALTAMRGLSTPRRPLTELGILQQLKGGLNFVRADRRALVALLMALFFAMFAMNNLTLLPIFADRILHSGAGGFGLLLTAAGLGAVISALVLAFERDGVPSAARMTQAALVLLAAMAGFALSPWIWLSVALMVVYGAAQIRLLATINTRLQLIAPDAMRGRVMALYAMAVVGSGPVGSLQAGALAGWLGAPLAMVAGASVAGGLLIILRAGLARGFSDDPVAPPGQEMLRAG